MPALQVTPLDAIPHDRLHVLGRTNGSLSPLTLFWTGSGLELNLRAGELWAEVETDFDFLEQWVAVVVNGAVVSRQPLPAGRHWLCLFRGMDPAKVKNVRLLKEIQAMPHDPKTRLQIHALRTDGELEPVAPRRWRLEFIGDSITSGEGIIGAKAEEDWIPMFFSAAYSYTVETANRLDADFRVLSQSGWGVRSSWDNDPNQAMPRVYTQVCGPLDNAENRALGAMEPNDFAAWQPHAVIINLGTNDGGALNQPAWADPATGKTFQQSADQAGREAFIQSVIDFLKLLREKNPGAYLLWAYGMLGRDMAAPIRQAVARYQVETGDHRAVFLQLPDTNQETVGSRGHSGPKAHAQAAEALADALKTILEVN